ncbi:MAG: NADH-quinone oxidoreductase subunit NuoH [Chloroflexi bacterium]|nr:NADH-quinone oxidoreductase subunit NuoH [Chloroflexota bacterium]
MDWVYDLFPKLHAAIEGWLRSILPPSIESAGVYIVMGVLSAFLLINVPLILVMVLIYMERRLLGRFQHRLGPNRVGWQGTLQVIADGIKLLTKEDIIPANVDRWVYNLAPVLFAIPVLLVFAVVPFGEEIYLTDLNIGILYIVALTATSTIFVFMAGWASNNKYSLIGAMRSVAQLISYEVPLVLSIVGVVLVVGSLSMREIVDKQSIPFILLQPLGFLVFIVAVSAELNRSPFDLLEAESELVTGYHIEYSGMKFGMFYLVEYIAGLAYSAVITTLFLGGWKGPILPQYVWFVAKVLLVFAVLIWIRATLPRVRIDQIMGFAWKFLFPLALINIFITALEVLLWPEGFPAWLVVVNLGVALGLLVVMQVLFRFPGATRHVVPQALVGRG